MKRRITLTLVTLVILIIFVMSLTAATFAKAGKTNPDLVRVNLVHYSSLKSKKPAKNQKYELLGFKWDAPNVTYRINPAGSGMNSAVVTSNISAAAETWDDATARDLFNDKYVVDTSASFGKMDTSNSIVFGSIGDDKVIAITAIWFNKKTKQILEFDIEFNTYFSWGEVTSPDDHLMDLRNIATHELGHAAGLGDIYNPAYSYVTMYGYSHPGDTEKTTLAAPDIKGLQKIYEK